MSFTHGLVRQRISRRVVAIAALQPGHARADVGKMVSERMIARHAEVTKWSTTEMLIEFEDGTTKTCALSPANCTGYRAKDITLDKHDIQALARMARLNPDALPAFIFQLEARFNRIGSEFDVGT